LVVAFFQKSQAEWLNPAFRYVHRITLLHLRRLTGDACFMIWFPTFESLIEFNKSRVLYKSLTDY
jgi:hypothetical protein